MGNSNPAPIPIPNTRKEFERILSDLLENHIQLFNQLDDEVVPPIPWEFGTPSEEEALEAIERGKAFLPLAYLEAYVQPLVQHLSTFIERCPDQYYEPLLGAIYDHEDQEVRGPLRQFSAVLSNFYRSFLDASRRVNVHFPDVAQLPPLAVFKSQESELGIFLGQFGPFSIPVDQIRSLFGGTVGVIVLPHTYAKHPLLWAVLAHEASGHDMLHVDKTLLPEMERTVEEYFHSGPGKHLLKSPKLKPGQNKLIGDLWSFWLEEAAAEVLAVLNIGPSYGFSLAVFMGLISQHIAQFFPFPPSSLIRLSSGLPLSTDPDAFESRPNPNRLDLDRHPVDILRLYVTIGAIESLNLLAPKQVKMYVRKLEKMAKICAQGSGKTISVHGWLPIEGDQWERKDEELDFGIMRDSARLVGRLLVTKQLSAFNNHSFQDLETWDNHDESIAQSIRVTLTSHDKEGIQDMGDDAQLLAGAALAFMDKPKSYESISTRLGEALANSFDRDVYWGLLGGEPAVSWSPDSKNKEALDFFYQKQAEIAQVKQGEKNSSSKKKTKLKIRKLTDRKKKKTLPKR